MHARLLTRAKRQTVQVRIGQAMLGETNQPTDQKQRYSVTSLTSPSMLPADCIQSKMDGQLPHHGSNCSEVRKRRSDSRMALLAL